VLKRSSNNDNDAKGLGISQVHFGHGLEVGENLELV